MRGVATRRGAKSREAMPGGAVRREVMRSGACRRAAWRCGAKRGAAVRDDAGSCEAGRSAVSFSTTRLGFVGQESVDFGFHPQVHTGITDLERPRKFARKPKSPCMNIRKRPPFFFA